MAYLPQPSDDGRTPSLEQIRHYLRRWCDQHHPHWRHVEILIHLHAVPPEPPTLTYHAGRLLHLAPAPREGPPPGRPPEPSACARDILRVLGEVGHRLTTSKLLSELARRGIEWSDRHVSQNLAQLVSEGILDNRQDAHPRGYGLPAWSDPPGPGRDH